MKEFVKGMEQSSQLLYAGDGSDSQAFSFSTILRPFTTTQGAENDAVIDRAPICCLVCGSYLNKYCIMSEDNCGRWKCCKSAIPQVNV